MSVIRVGSTSTYAVGWDAIFGGGKAGRGTKAGGRKARKAAATTAKRTTKAKPKAVKAARKARRKQSARTKR